MNKIARLLFLILLHLATYSAFGQGDTISISKIDSCKISKSGQFYFASNFQQLVNFHNDNNFNLDITTRASLARNKSTRSYRSKQETNIELSFTKYIDSIIDVRDDEIELKGNWEFQFINVVNSININIKTQMTNAYEYTFLKDEFIKVLSKQPLLPIIFNIGTGFNFDFRKGNLVNFSPVDLKTTFLSDKISSFYPQHKNVSSNFSYMTEIGSSITVSINKSWAKDLFNWRNSSRIFIKGLTKEDATLYTKNRIMYELFKSINISFENQMVYEPLYNYKLQVKNEIVLGVCFKK